MIRLGALVGGAALLVACVGQSGFDAGFDAGIPCEQVTAMLDNPMTPAYPVMDLGPCNNVGDQCQSMPNCMTGHAPREWSCTCETEAHRWVCQVTMYCPVNPGDGGE